MLESEAVKKEYAHMVERGRPFPKRGRIFMRGAPNACHENSAELYQLNADRVKIATGYALYKDGCWRRHSWLVLNKKEKVVETTVAFEQYFGYVIEDEKEIGEFLYYFG